MSDNIRILSGVYKGDEDNSEKIPFILKVLRDSKFRMLWAVDEAFYQDEFEGLKGISAGEYNFLRYNL